MKGTIVDALIERYPDVDDRRAAMIMLLSVLELDLSCGRSIGSNWLDEALKRIRPQDSDRPPSPPIRGNHPKV